MSVCFCTRLCVWVCVFFFLFIYVHAAVCVCVHKKKNKKLKCVPCDAQLAAAGPCKQAPPFQSNPSHRQEPLKSTVYPFAGSPLKDLLYLLSSIPPIDSDEYPLRHNEACVCSHSRFIKQQTLFFTTLGFSGVKPSSCVTE